MVNFIFHIIWDESIFHIVFNFFCDAQNFTITLSLLYLLALSERWIVPSSVEGDGWKIYFHGMPDVKLGFSAELTRQSVKPSQPTRTRIDKPCAWIWHGHQLDDAGASPTQTGVGATKWSQGGIPSRILQCGQNCQHEEEFQPLN